MFAEKPLVNFKELRDLIRSLEDLKHPQHQQSLEARWLNYVQWWDGRASEAKRQYFLLRGTVVVGSALLPALVSVQQLGGLQDYGTTLALVAIGVSLLVAIAGALEGLLNSGEIWRHKRDAAELLKSEGFRFFQLIGPYARFQSHADAYPAFAESVEKLIRQEIQTYVAIVAEPPSRPPGGAPETRGTASQPGTVTSADAA